MATKTFEQYFKDRALAVGAQPSGGDEKLVMRGDTVVRSLDINSRAIAYMSGNTTPTGITGIDVWTSIGGTLSLGISAACWSFTGNVFTYIGPTQSLPVMLMANATLTKTAVGVENFELGILVNSALKFSSIRTSVNVGEYAALSTCVPHVLSTGDAIEMAVRGKDSTSDVTLTEAQLVIL